MNKKYRSILLGACFVLPMVSQAAGPVDPTGTIGFTAAQACLRATRVVAAFRGETRSCKMAALDSTPGASAHNIIEAEKYKFFYSMFTAGAWGVSYAGIKLMLEHFYNKTEFTPTFYTSLAFGTLVGSGAQLVNQLYIPNPNFKKLSVAGSMLSAAKGAMVIGIALGANTAGDLIGRSITHQKQFQDAPSPSSGAHRKLLADNSAAALNYDKSRGAYGIMTLAMQGRPVAKKDDQYNHGILDYQVYWNSYKCYKTVNTHGQEVIRSYDWRYEEKCNAIFTRLTYLSALWEQGALMMNKYVNISRRFHIPKIAQHMVDYIRTANDNKLWAEYNWYKYIAKNSYVIGLNESPVKKTTSLIRIDRDGSHHVDDTIDPSDVHFVTENVRSVEGNNVPFPLPIQ